MTGRITQLEGSVVWESQEVSRRVSASLKGLTAAGVERGDRVFLHHGNTAQFFVDLLAAWKAGAAAVPIDRRLTVFEVANLAHAARPKLALWSGPPDPEHASSLESLNARSVDTAQFGETGPADEQYGSLPILDDDALILFTSGTTGDPKGVVHTHRSLAARWTALRQALGTKAFQESLCLLPTHFGHGLICNCLFPWLSGCNLTVLPPFRPDIVSGLGRIVDEVGATFLSSVPAMWKLALRVASPPVAGTLQRVFCGSAPLSADLWSQIREWTGAPDVRNSYGITETGSWTAGLAGPVAEFADGLIGKGWGAEIRVTRRSSGALRPDANLCDAGEEGHVWLRTPALMRGYFERDDLTGAVVSQGWFYTGDIGLIDENGDLFLRGREREEINKGGAKIHPGDIDGVLEKSEVVTDVCSFAYADPLLGEDVGVAVVLTDQAHPADVLAWAEKHLAEFRIPRKWYIVQELPRTSRGKVNRSQVADTCSSLQAISLSELRSRR
jgi:acyl-CoA synthetase (AMP-forming)/AMP-acid ligase II